VGTDLSDSMGPASDSLREADSGGTLSGNRIPDFLVEGPAGESISGIWIDVVIPGDPGPVTPFVDGVPVAHTTTGWGIRVPLGDIPAGESRLVSFRTPSSQG
jgi:hypothetical protein